jgi:hypothetical protein
MKHAVEVVSLVMIALIQARSNERTPHQQGADGV